MLHLDFLVLRSKYFTISIIIYHPTFSLVKLKTSGKITGKTTRNPPDYESKYLSSHQFQFVGGKQLFIILVSNFFQPENTSFLSVLIVFCF